MASDSVTRHNSVFVRRDAPINPYADQMFAFPAESAKSAREMAKNPTAKWIDPGAVKEDEGDSQ